jgi:hypothetical protein
MFKKTLVACCRFLIPAEGVILSEVLLKLMGDSRADAEASTMMRKGTPEVRYRKGRSGTDKNCEIPVNVLMQHV